MSDTSSTHKRSSSSSLDARRASRRRRSTIDVYREWLDASSSSSSSSSDEAQRPAQGQRRAARSPSKTPPAAKKPFIKLSSTPVETPPRQPSRQRGLMSTPRKLAQQMSFRAMLATAQAPQPEPQPLAALPVEPPELLQPPPLLQQRAAGHAEGGGTVRPDARARIRGRQASVGTLFSDAWIAQPTRTRRGSSLHGEPADERAVAAAAKAAPSSSDSSDTVSEKPPAAGARRAKAGEEGRLGAGADWEFHRIDSSRGWWVVGWAALACFVSLSTLINYPVYEAHYADAHGGGGGRRVSAQVVLIGTLMSGFAALGSLGAGIAADVLGLRICAGAGTVVLCLGLLASSFIDRLWALCLTQGVVCGVGIALMAMPAYVAPAQWFDRHRALSTGVAVAGTGLGVVALTPAYESLLRARGMAVCLYVQAVLTLVLGLAASLGLRPRVSLRSPAAMRWRQTLRDPRVLVLMAMALLAAAARFAQAVCLPAIAWAAGVRDDATNVLYVVGAALLAGMVAGGAVADKTGYIAAVGLSELVLGVFTLALFTPAKAVAPVYAFAVVFGLATGALAAVLPPAIAQMLGSRRLATATGLVLAAAAPALLATTPAAVKLTRLLADGRSVAWLCAISGALSLAAGALGMTLPLLHRRHLRRHAQRGPAVAVAAAS